MKAWSLLLMLLATPAFAEMALEMQSDCSTFRSAKMRGDEVALDQNFETGECWGAFAALQGEIVLVGVDGTRLLKVCAPPESTRVEIIKMFLRYADEHPEQGHKEFWVVALNALVAAFPCKQ